MNDNTLEILKWVAIGKEEDVLEYDDTIGQKCVFDCGYDTSLAGEEHQKHSEQCLMNIARRELSESGYPLRKYVVEYALRYEPTEQHQEKYPYFSLKEYRQQKEIYYEIGLLKFNYFQFAFEKQLEEQNRIDPEQEKFIVSIRNETIIIKPPIFLMGTEEDTE